MIEFLCSGLVHPQNAQKTCPAGERFLVNCTCKRRLVKQLHPTLHLKTLDRQSTTAELTGKCFKLQLAVIGE